MSDPDPLQFTVEPQEGGVGLERWLTGALPNLSMERARRLVSEGRVLVRGEVPEPLCRVRGGDEVVVTLPPPRPLPAKVAPPPPVTFLHQGRDVVVVDKPAGITAETLALRMATTLEGVNVGGGSVPGLVQRLEKGTTGCLVLARTDVGMAALAEAFEKGHVVERWTAVVLGEAPDDGSMDTHYARDPSATRRYTTRVRSKKRARLLFKTVGRLPGASVLDVQPRTFRNHQVRVQLSERGLPVLGDDVYGTEPSRSHPVAQALGRMVLHVGALEVPALGVAVTCPMPEDMQRALTLPAAPDVEAPAVSSPASLGHG